MTIKIIQLVLFIFYILPSFSQQRLITCSLERNADNSISIISDNRASGDYTVKLIFTSLADYTTSSLIIANTLLATVKPGKREILKLQNKLASASAFQYNYLCFPGRALRKAPDSSFVYLLPANAGNNIRISKVSPPSALPAQETPGDYFGTGFVYNSGDTICASRGGIVYDYTDNVSEGEKTDDYYKTGRNKIHIQHNDGSLGVYDILAPIQLLVHPGDVVYPGKPLGIFTIQSEKYAILFSTWYLDEKKIMNAGNTEDKPVSSNLVYIPTHFYTGANSQLTPLQVNNSYIVQHPKEIITAEMNKKDKKKWGF